VDNICSDTSEIRNCNAGRTESTQLSPPTYHSKEDISLHISGDICARSGSCNEFCILDLLDVNSTFPLISSKLCFHYGAKK
jgi:hypothetical protein